MLGWKPQRRAEPEEIAPSDIAELAGLAGLTVERGGPAGPIIDLDEMRERNRLLMLEIGRRNAAAG